jgi:hypothetical protein
MENAIFKNRPVANLHHSGIRCGIKNTIIKINIGSISTIKAYITWRSFENQ